MNEISSTIGKGLGNTQSEKDFYSAVETKISNDENILWAASPKGRYTFSDKQKERFSNVGSSLFYLALIIGALYLVISQKRFGYGLVALAYLGYRVVMDMFSTLHQERTHYALTEKRLFIQTWEKFRKRLKFIELENIKTLNVEEGKNNTGTVFIFCYRHPEIFTVDYASGELQVCPTLEEIEYPDQVINLLNKLKNRL